MDQGMNNTDFFANPLITVQLICVYSHLNTLSDFFYSRNFLAKDDQFQPIPIVNSLYEYFQDNDHNPSIKNELVHELLLGSDLYGAKRNESIDLDYVNAMLDYIISDVVFKKFGNIYGFSAFTMLTRNNVTLSTFIEEMRLNLLKARYTNEDGSISYLNFLAVRNVLEKIILPLFPKAENNTSIVSPDHIHAQAGLAFARAAKMDVQNISFQELVEISQTMEFSVREAQMDHTALIIFALPATLYYFHTEKNILLEGTFTSLVFESDYWVTAYDKLFQHLDSTFGKLQKTLEEEQEKRPTSKFGITMSLYKTRTQLAEENIRLFCPLEDEGDYEDAISEYKNDPGGYFCKEEDMTLPNVNELFNKQNDEIVHQYFSMEKKLMKAAFENSAVQWINSSDTIIYETTAGCWTYIFEPEFGLIPIYSPKMKDSVDLLEIYNITSETSVHYALIREEDGIILIKDVNRKEFNERIDSDKDSVFQRTSKVLKHEPEMFDTFANRIAEKRTDGFREMLQNKGYDETNWEKAKRILLSIIPFYNCIDDILKKKTTEAVIDCSIDALTLIPVYGAVMNIGFKIFSKALLTTLGTSVKTFAFRETIHLSLRTLGKGVLSQAVAEFSNVFTKETFTTISLSLLRSLDPGFEFIGRLSTTGIKSTTRLLSLIKRQLSFSLYKKITNSLDKLKNSVKRMKIGQFEGRDLYLNSLSGTNGFGHKFISTPHGVFELRRVHRFKNEVVVKLERVVNGKKIYRKVNLETGETYGLDYELRDDILQTIMPPLSERINNIQTIGLSGRGAIAGSRKFQKLQKQEAIEKALTTLKKALTTLKNAPKKSDIKEEQVRKILREYLWEQKDKTKLDLVDHLIHNFELPPWIQELKLEELDLFWKLRYEESLSSKEITYDEAVAKIKGLYPHYVLREIGVDIHDVVEIFSNQNAYVDVLFEDLYAILNYVDTGYRRIGEESDEARMIQNALYRLAVRQADDSEKLPKLLYRAERRDVNVANSFTKGSVIEMNKFTSTSIDEDVAYIHLDIIPDDPSIVPILYEMQLDSSFLAADIYKICPFLYEKESVLIPGVKLVIDKIQDVITSEGRKVKKLFVRNLPVDKSQWLIQLMKRIRSLKATRTRFYYDTSSY